MKPLLLLTALLLCGCEPDKVAEWTANSEPNLESRESYRIMRNGAHFKVQRKSNGFERGSDGRLWGRTFSDNYEWTDDPAARKPTFATIDEASAEIDWLIRKRLTDMGKARAEELKQATERWVDVTPLAKTPTGFQMLAKTNIETGEIRFWGVWGTNAALTPP